MRPTRRHWLIGLLGSALLAVAPGCKEELGPERMPTTRVTGRVHVRGRPVGRGWIEFYPTEGTVGTVRSARLRPDGTFDADRVAIGRNAIKLTDAPRDVMALLPDSRAMFEAIPRIRRDVPDAAPGRLDIDLQDEWLRLRRRPASPAPPPRTETRDPADGPDPTPRDDSRP